MLPPVISHSLRHYSILYSTHIHDITQYNKDKSLVNFDFFKPDHPSNDALPGKPLIVCLHWNLEETMSSLKGLATVGAKKLFVLEHHCRISILQQFIK